MIRELATVAVWSMGWIQSENKRTELPDNKLTLAANCTSASTQGGELRICVLPISISTNLMNMLLLLTVYVSLGKMMLEQRATTAPAKSTPRNSFASIRSG